MRIWLRAAGDLTDDVAAPEETCESGLLDCRRQRVCRNALDRKSVAQVTDFWEQLRHLLARAQPLGTLSGPD
jgi:hypothetical protein